MCADKTEDDAEREAQLLEMRLTLTEERNAVMVPSAGSGIPGAPAEWYEHILLYARECTARSCLALLAFLAFLSLASVPWMSKAVKIRPLALIRLWI